MKVRVPSQIWGMVAAILFLVAHPSQGIAAATSLEAYNPKEDPNYAQGTSRSLGARGKAVWELVKDFQGKAIPMGEASQETAHSATAQPEQYTQAVPPTMSTSSDALNPVFGGPFAYRYYRNGRWGRSRWGRSPRIPWWSLIPFARGDKDFHFRGRFGHFPFRHHRGGHFRFGFGHFR